MQEGQTLEEAVSNVLFNLTGIHGIHQEQVKCYSQVERHPVKRVLTVSFYALIKPENHPLIAKNYITQLEWFPINRLPEKLAFDHQTQFEDSLSRLRTNLREKLIFGELLPQKFTLKELQDLYESVLDEKLDRRNFRKKILLLGLLEKTKEKKAGAKGGPDLYRIVEGKE